MSPVYDRCPDCGAEENRDGHCVNPNCERAQRQATADAARDTAKATASVSRPQAFGSSGRVD